MKNSTKLVIGLTIVTAATKAIISNISEKETIKIKKQDKINYEMAEKLILKAEQIRESDIGKRALFDKNLILLPDKKEEVKTLDMMNKMYDYAEQYIGKIQNREDRNIEKVELLIKRRKNTIKNRFILLNER